MAVPIVLLPTGQGVGLFSLKHGLQYALMERGYKVALFNPLNDSNCTASEIESYFQNNNEKAFFELMLNQYEALSEKADFVLITGVFIKHKPNNPFLWLNEFIKEFNLTLIRALGAKVILIARHGNKESNDIETQLSLSIQGIDKDNIIGAIITKLNAPVDAEGNSTFSLIDDDSANFPKASITVKDIEKLALFQSNKLMLLGCTFWQEDLTYPRVCDIQNTLKLNVLSGNNNTLSARVKTASMCSRTIDNVLDEIKPGVMIVTAADRSDIIIATTLAAQKGMQISALILTAYQQMANDQVIQFCLDNMKNCNLPILATNHKSISTILKLATIDYSGIPEDDQIRLQNLKHSIAKQIQVEPIELCLKQTTNKKMSPPAFRHYLIKRAQSHRQRIILPEAEDPRILKAASYCQQQGIAEISLLGEPNAIYKTTEQHDIRLPSDITIISPRVIKSQYIFPLVELRKHKGMNEIMANDVLEDRITLATMMLARGDVDGLVAGALNTTAKTISPAFKLIKTKPECKLISSVFFMCLEEQVLIYGDCAVNPDPDVSELAEIAIQSAHTAQAFGITPKVAMISYSTGSSASGIDVEKVKEATALVKHKMPDLVIDGPLQYDAATVLEVGKQKAPNSPVAGKANVIIFPDLNTGNTTYKAVQRSANALSIGPVLQGLNKPVNDLSRGTTVDDIIYTIAITAIQSQSAHH